MLKNCFLIFFFLIFTNLTFGQNLQKMQIWQDSLFQLGQKVFSNTSEAERIESNFLFVKTLVSALKEPNSYYFDFEKLNVISCLRSPDNNFRIFSWNVPLHDGSYLFYGSMQLKSGDLKLIPLLDKTFEIKDVNKESLESSMWYGAQYYEIIPFTKNQYLLLGWKGHQSEYTHKVIEVLNILPNNIIQFGAPVFSEDKSIFRKIFSYDRNATMFVKYNKTKNRIEFDNLVAIDSSKGKNYKKLVPDLSHNGYEIRNGKLYFVENIEALNPDGFELPNADSKTKVSGF